MACYWYDLGGKGRLDNQAFFYTDEIISMGAHSGNSTVEPTDPPPEHKMLYVGFIAAAIAVVLFGTNFAPVKKFKSGDGELVLL